VVQLYFRLLDLLYVGFRCSISIRSELLAELESWATAFAACCLCGASSGSARAHG
jgi:hypothetical protein